MVAPQGKVQQAQRPGFDLQVPQGKGELTPKVVLFSDLQKGCGMHAFCNKQTNKCNK